MCDKLGYTAAQYVARANTGFQRLAVMGVTIMVSDGDDGAQPLLNGTARGADQSSRLCSVVTAPGPQSAVSSLERSPSLQYRRRSRPQAAGGAAPGRIASHRGCATCTST